MKKDFSKVFKTWKNTSPRINDLSDNFAFIALGKSGVPIKTPLDEHDVTDLFCDDKFVLEFYSECKKNFGTFGKHYISSIPYSLQELCRLGSALTMYLLRLSQINQCNSYFQSIGSAEGVMARTIAKLGKGSIYTLTNSSTPENSADFFRNGAPTTASFFAGPYFDISPYDLKNIPELKSFKHGFDVVFEDTCFQMHAKNRAEQIAWVCQNLRNNGLLICFEKCFLGDVNEYQRREKIKDSDFKARYFSSSQIVEKKNTILGRMRNGQVSLKKLVKDLSFSMNHIAVIWNSGNFYILIASNDHRKIEEFCSNLLPPCIPSYYKHMKLPKTLYGNSLKLVFRKPIIKKHN